jgi:hypothetical protein
MCDESHGGVLSITLYWYASALRFLSFPLFSPVLSPLRFGRALLLRPVFLGRGGARCF